MREVKFLSQSFAMKGLVVFFSKGEVGGSQPWYRILAFEKEAAIFYFG